MGCLTGITAVIANSCTNQPKLGLVGKAWVINRADIATITADTSTPTKITEITLALGEKQAWTITAYRQDIDAGFDLVSSETMPESYKHYFKVEPWDEKSAQVLNLDNMEDIVVIVERVGNSLKDAGDGAFQIYGLRNGLYKSSASGRANANNGVPTYEFTSRDGQEEDHSKYIFFDTSYATTLGKLVGLETPTEPVEPSEPVEP